jgi:hypothetical protein
MLAHSKKNIRTNAKNIFKEMDDNKEILIEGQIPGSLIQRVK